MTSALTGQLILGTDKRNPLFTVYAEEDQEQLHVYYGLELLEVVSADRNDPNFKMLVGRLYNAGLNLVVRHRTFGIDPKTIQRWGQALRSRDAEELLRVLAGRRGRRKLTAEIEAFVRVRWAELSRSGTYGLGQRLRQEMESVFDVKISQETLRPLLGKLKRGKHQPGARRLFRERKQPQGVSRNQAKASLMDRRLARQPGRLLAIVSWRTGRKGPSLPRCWKPPRKPTGVITRECFCSRRPCWPSRRCWIGRSLCSGNGWPVSCWGR